MSNIILILSFRERAGGGDILSVEKTMKRQAQQEEKKSIKRAEAEARRDQRERSLFSFINNRLGGKKGSVQDLIKSDGRKETKNNFISNKNLKKESSQDLKIRSFKLGEDISKVEKDIQRLKESYNRHKDKVSCQIIHLGVNTSIIVFQLFI